MTVTDDRTHTVNGKTYSTNTYVSIADANGFIAYKYHLGQGVSKTWNYNAKGDLHWVIERHYHNGGDPSNPATWPPYQDSGDVGTIPCGGSCTPGQPGCQGIGCPSMPDPNYAFNLPDSGVQGGLPGNPSDGQTATAYIPNGNYEIDAFYDQFGQTSDKWSPKGQHPNPFSADYTDFIEQYPYDMHHMSIYYTEYYYRWDAVYNATYDAEGNVTGGSWSLTGITPNQGLPFIYHPKDLSPCYNRNFNMDTGGTHGNNVLLSPSNEDPNTVNFSSTLAINYGLESPKPGYLPWTPPDPNAPVRVPIQREMDWAANYLVRSVDGSAVSLYSKSSGGGTVIPPALPASGNTSTQATDSASVSVPPLRIGDRICMDLTASWLTGLVDNYDGRIVHVSQSGSYGAPEVCSSNIVNEPYTHAFGSDVSAGGSFADSTCTSDGSIYTYTYDGKKRGSGTQFGALSINQILGFSSANLRTQKPTDPNPFALAPIGLTFSNTKGISGSSLPAPNNGGLLGGTHCISDYFATKPASLATPNTSGADINVSSLDKASYYQPPASTSQKINGGLIADGKAIAIYVKGNAYITSDIVFQNSSWTKTGDIPSVYIIAKGGNIYIDPAVSRLDAILVAQPSSGSGGNIDSCASANGRFDNGSKYSTCHRQLLVNGAFIANKVHLDRTFGSLRFSVDGENVQTPGNRDCSKGTEGAGLSTTTSLGDCAGEIFNFNPAIYLAQPAINKNSGPTAGVYDSITSLSPVL